MNVQALPDKEQSCDVANALSAASLFTRAKKGWRVAVDSTDACVSLTQRQILRQDRHVQHHQNLRRDDFSFRRKP
jgi:hypothetical protein